MHLSGIEIQDNVFVPFVDTVSNLGVVMDSKLTWKAQVDAVSRKVNRALYGLRRFRCCTTENLRKQLVSSLVLSHLDYCSLVYLDMTRELQNKLQILQNSCVTYVTSAKKNEHISPYRNKLEWLDLRERRAYFAAVLMYKVINLDQPVYLAHLFQKCQNRTLSRTHCGELIVPSSRTDVGLDSFWSQGTRLWNSIPRDIKNVSSASKLKAAFRKYLMQRSGDVDCIYM